MRAVGSRNPVGLNSGLNNFDQTVIFALYRVIPRDMPLEAQWGAYCIALALHVLHGDGGGAVQGDSSISLFLLEANWPRYRDTKLFITILS